MRGSLSSLHLASASSSRAIVYKQTGHLLRRQSPFLSRHLSTSLIRNSASTTMGIEVGNAWVGVKGAGSLDLRSEN